MPVHGEVPWRELDLAATVNYAISTRISIWRVKMMKDRSVENCFRSLERSLFLGESMKQYAGHDAALPIGCGQTISQPSLVLKMTQLLAPQKSSRVLEIGTGSGYQTALLAELCDTVYTVERVPELASLAQERLMVLGYTNIMFKVGDGSDGWVDHAPYDRVMVTAAALTIPDELVEQLAHGGRMVIPVGPRDLQQLKVVTRAADGTVAVFNEGYVIFVEMKGKYGWRLD